MKIEEQLALIKRGAVNIIDEEDLAKKVARSIETGIPLKIKYGADPSASDLHLGHTVPLNKLRQFQNIGHEVVFIIGDFTAMIGDPSGKSKTRPKLSREEVLSNAKTYQEQIFKILLPEKTQIVFNNDWFSKMMFEDIITLASKYTVARMLERDDFTKRYTNGVPISMLEFFYPLIQGYDSVKIKSDVEIGGTDQTFNFLVARDLQREYSQEPQVMLTLPILEGTDGIQKMSKSLGNYIGISEPPNDIFGKVMSISDDMMFRYYELLTARNNSEIDKMKEDVQSGKVHPMEAKKTLSSELVERFYDKDSAVKAKQEFERVFSKKKLPSEIPEVTISNKDGDRIWLVNLVRRCDLNVSNSEIRRLIKQGAVNWNGDKCSDENSEVNLQDGAILKVGKRKFWKIKVANN
ncbi:MAG: tyrosine--tRNA ligase [Candidatus Theseobacter exili]|nr:tyrosine--tRNA ligase [Candidatus Theseobacter exili]